MTRNFLTSTAIAFSLVQSGPALAQAAAGDEGIGEIVVTAQKREENVQETALSIAVFGGDDLKELGVSRADDLTRITTGMQVGGGTTTQIYIRGVGDFGVIATANPAVVTSLNGVPIARPQAISGNFFDLERIEVLKGPQGTLYGRNASGGALNLIAARPRLGESSGYFDATIGNYGLLSGEGAINVQAGESSALRLAFQVTDRDGYLTDGTEDDSHQSFRLLGRFEPNDAFTLQLGGGYVHLGGKGSGFAVIPRIPGQSAWTGSASEAAADYYLAIATANFSASGGQSPPPFLIDRPDASKLFQDVESWHADAELSYDFGAASLTVIPAYRATRARYAIQPTFRYSPGEAPSEGDSSDQYSLEVRLGGESERLKWVVGFFGFHEDQTSDWALNAGIIQRLHTASDLKTKAYAGFGEVTYSLSDVLRATAGIRYTSDKRSQTDFRKFAISPSVAGWGFCVPSATMPGGECDLLPAVNFDSSTTFEKVTWKLGIEADLAENSMLFATVSTGFKAGGFNQAVDPATGSSALPFSPETITAYTLGLRNRFLDNRLQLNLEGFYWDYKDLQLSQTFIDSSGNASLVTQNAGKGRIYGFNADVVAKPARGTTIHAGVEYLDTKYTRYTYVQAAMLTGPGSTGCAVSPSSLPPGPAGPFVSIDCSGYPLVRAPKWSGNVGLQQVFGLASGGEVELATDLAFASKRWTSTSFTTFTRAKSYANWNASLTYNAPGDRWYVGTFARNITKAKIYTGGGGHDSPFVTGYATSSIGAPRTYGMRAGVRF